MINVHALGAVVRLDDGELAAIALDEVLAHRPVLLKSLERRQPIAFERESDSVSVRRTALRVARDPQPLDPGETMPTAAPIALHDDAFEARMADYLRSTEDWAPPDLPQPADRHFLRKKRRAAYFEP